ncbi:MAG: hypothetical protein AAFY28_17295, partial [Actinomycetota bacterium]
MSRLDDPADTTTAAADGDRGAARQGSRRAALIVIGGCALLAALSLLLPGALSYDPTAWVIWGREVGRFELDTVTGPSWKPLPVIVTTIVAPLGDTAPDVWMWVARTAGLLALVGVVRLGARLAGPVAGGLAGALLILTPDGEPRFIRTWAEGHDATATAALAGRLVVGGDAGGREHLPVLQVPTVEARGRDGGHLQHWQML